MKKWIALMLSLILALTLTACGAEKTVGEPEAKPESGEVQADVPAPAAPTDAQESTAPAAVWGVTLTAEDVTSTGLMLVCTQSGGTADGEPRDWGHCGLCIGEGRVIHAWDRIRIDDYRTLEQLSPAHGWTQPRYIGWVPLERVLAQKP